MGVEKSSNSVIISYMVVILILNVSIICKAEAQNLSLRLALTSNLAASFSKQSPKT